MARSLQFVTPEINTFCNDFRNTFCIMTLGPGERLRYALERKDMSAAELGRRTGIKDGTVRQDLHRNTIPYPKARKYARVLGCTPDWLITGDGPDPFGPPSRIPEENARISPERGNDTGCHISDNIPAPDEEKREDSMPS